MLDINSDSIIKRVEQYQADGRTGMVLSLDVIQALLDRCQETPTPEEWFAAEHIAHVETPHPATQVSGQDLPPHIDDAILCEKIAHQVHADWSRWMKYLFRCGQMLDDGRFVMDANKVSRWQRQMTTPYEQLTRDDRRSDIAIAHRYLKILAGCD